MGRAGQAGKSSAPASLASRCRASSWPGARRASGRAGLQDRVELRARTTATCRHRHAAEPFDAIVSIEMFGGRRPRVLAAYFDTLRTCLKPGGRACIQTITIRDDLFERYRRSTDFIQQYIFPGGLLPSIPAFEREARRAGFVVEQRLAFGPDYAEMLCWRWRGLPGQAQACRVGFDQRFERIWLFYRPTARPPSTPATPMSSSSPCARATHERDPTPVPPPRWLAGPDERRRRQPALPSTPSTPFPAMFDAHAPAAETQTALPDARLHGTGC